MKAAHNALPDARAAMQVFLAGALRLSPEVPVSKIPGLLGPFHSVASPSVHDIEITGNPEELTAIASARITIEMDYSTCMDLGPVVVTPYKTFEGNGQRYLRAYCHRDGIHKTYRLDRIIDFRRI